MGLARSLSVGASSLQAHRQAFDVISNNIANVSTVGFKQNTVTFSEAFNQVYNFGTSADEDTGGTNPTQFGLGVNIGSINTDFTQGVIESSENSLDMAISGEGYFVYNQYGNDYYSRAGSINQDKAGNLVDTTTGAFLQGYNIETDANGRTIKDSNGDNILDRSVENISISPNTLSMAKQTQSVAVSGNLNSAMAEGESRTTSIDIYDNYGASRNLGITFTKTANDNEYTISATIDGNNVNLSSSSLTFNNDGTLNTPLSLNITAADLNTAMGGNLFDATTPKDITINLGDANNLISNSLTQFASSNTATANDQNGYASGSLKGFSVDSEGKIWGAFTNGQSEVLGQTIIAKFANPGGLVNEGNNYFSASVNSGSANIGTAGEIFPSSLIKGSSLEQSNVELTEQFTNIISTQRAYEAASRIITVTDQMLSEVNQLKR